MSLVWFLRYYLKVQSAIRWWSGRQSQQLAKEAQNIRDGLLQQSFSLRRSLELSLWEDAQLSPHHCQSYLEKLEEFHQALVQLSDRLAPTYLEESLPLAIEQLLYHKQKQYHQLKWQFETPKLWTEEESTCNWLILNAMDELINLICSQIYAETLLKVSLQEHNYRRELRIQINHPDGGKLPSLDSSGSWQHLSKLFSVVTCGHCFYSCQETTIDVNFCWRSKSPLKPQYLLSKI